MCISVSVYKCFLLSPVTAFGSIGTHNWCSSHVPVAVVSINWFVLSTRRSQTLNLVRHWTNFRLLACCGTEKREDRAFWHCSEANEGIVPLTVQMAFELKSIHLNIQSFRPLFCIPRQTKATPVFLMMTLQMWSFPYQVSLHFSSPS